MYVTLYAADNQQIVLDTIKDTENAKPLFINHSTFDGNKTSVICASASRRISMTRDPCRRRWAKRSKRNWRI